MLVYPVCTCMCDGAMRWSNGETRLATSVNACPCWCIRYANACANDDNALRWSSGDNALRWSSGDNALRWSNGDMALTVAPRRSLRLRPLQDGIDLLDVMVPAGSFATPSVHDVLVHGRLLDKGARKRDIQRERERGREDKQLMLRKNSSKTEDEERARERTIRREGKTYQKGGDNIERGQIDRAKGDDPWLSLSLCLSSSPHNSVCVSLSPSPSLTLSLSAPLPLSLSLFLCLSLSLSLCLSPIASLSPSL